MTSEQAMDKFFRLHQARFNGLIQSREGLTTLNAICNNLKVKFK